MKVQKRTSGLYGSLSALLAGALMLFQAPAAEASFCDFAKNSAQLARTAYNSSSSDKKKYLPSGFTYVRSFSSTKYSGGDHAYLTTSQVLIPEGKPEPGKKPAFKKETVCHYTIRGLNTSKLSIKSQVKEIAKMTKQATCYTASKKKIGKCSERIYNRYTTLRDGLLKSIKLKIKRKKCFLLMIHGHSMGGSIANLLAAELYLLDSKQYDTKFMKVHTYGSPRVFGSSDAETWHKRLNVTRWAYSDKAKVVKTVYQGDMVTKLPMGAYAHIGQTYMIHRRRYVTKSDTYSYGKKSRQWHPEHGIGWKHEASNYTNALNKGCK